jgi:uncharacterized protein YndB with AHSA1/START domain
MVMTEGSANIVINRPVGEVFDAIADITRMGEWSPECTGGRWVAPATGPETSAEFEGDNVAKLGPVTLKRWTTTSRVTECAPNQVFEFVAEGYTTWRYEFSEQNGSTTVTESFSHEPYTGMQGFLYGTLLRREAGMVKGMQQTLGRVKAALEAS